MALPWGPFLDRMPAKKGYGRGVPVKGWPRGDSTLTTLHLCRPIQLPRGDLGLTPSSPKEMGTTHSNLERPLQMKCFF